MSDMATNFQPYFKIDDVANRWGLSRDAVMSYGIAGQLKFGLFATGLLHVEVGSYGTPPKYDFIVESSGFWSGFIPIKPEMVAALYLNGGTDHWQIPDTSCGKSVCVLEYIPHDECDESPTLLVAGEEVERFEREVPGFCDKLAAPIGTDKGATEATAAAGLPDVVSPEVSRLDDLNARVKRAAQEAAESIFKESNTWPKMSPVARRLVCIASMAVASGDKDALFYGQKGAHKESWYKAHLQGWQPEEK